MNRSDEAELQEARSSGCIAWQQGFGRLGIRLVTAWHGSCMHATDEPRRPLVDTPANPTAPLVGGRYARLFPIKPAKVKTIGLSDISRRCAQNVLFLSPFLSLSQTMDIRSVPVRVLLVIAGLLTITFLISGRGIPRSPDILPSSAIHSHRDGYSSLEDVANQTLGVSLATIYSGACTEES